MTFYALEARYVPKIYRMFERFVGLVASFAFAISQASEIDRMLEEFGLQGRRRIRGISQDGVTDIAVVADHFARVANVLTIVTAETTREIEMTDVVWMGLPVGLHLGKEIGLIYTLGLTYGALYRALLLRVHLAVIRLIKTIQPGSDRLHRLVL